MFRHWPEWSAWVQHPKKAFFTLLFQDPLVQGLVIVLALGAAWLIFRASLREMLKRVETNPALLDNLDRLASVFNSHLGRHLVFFGAFIIVAQFVSVLFVGTLTIVPRMTLLIMFIATTLTELIVCVIFYAIWRGLPIQLIVPLLRWTHWRRGAREVRRKPEFAEA